MPAPGREPAAPRSPGPGERPLGTLRAVRIDQVLPVARQPGRHRRPLARPDRGAAGGRVRLGHLLRQLHPRRGRTSAGRSTELGRRPRTAGSSTTPRSGARSSTSLAARPEGKLSTTTTSPRPSSSRAGPPRSAYEVALGRSQLERLAPDSRFAVADSAFNECELVAAGYRDTAVVPLLIDMTSTGEEPDPAVAGAAGPGQGGRRRRPALRGQGLAPQGAP